MLCELQRLVRVTAKEVVGENWTGLSCSAPRTAHIFCTQPTHITSWSQSSLRAGRHPVIVNIGAPFSGVSPARLLDTSSRSRLKVCSLGAAG